MKILTKNSQYHFCYRPIIGDGTIDYQVESYASIDDLLHRNNCLKISNVECFGEWQPEYAFGDVMLALIQTTPEWADAEILDLTPVEVVTPASITQAGMVSVPEVTL